MPALRLGKAFQDVIRFRLIRRRQPAWRQAVMQRRRVVWPRLMRRRRLLRRRQAPPSLSRLNLDAAVEQRRREDAKAENKAMLTISPKSETITLHANPNPPRVSRLLALSSGLPAAIVQVVRKPRGFLTADYADCSDFLYPWHPCDPWSIPPCGCGELHRLWIASSSSSSEAPMV